MAEQNYTRSDSDRNLDKSATAQDAATDRPGPGHDPAEIRKHDDTGKDRLFEGREQHDEAEKASEKTRLAKDVQRHDHPVDDNVADSGNAAGAKRKG